MHASDRFPPFYKLYRSFKIHAWLGLFVFGTVVSSAVIYMYTVTPKYLATTTITIDGTKPNIMNFQEFINSDINMESFQTQLKIISSRSVAKRVIESLGLQNNEELQPRVSFLKKITQTVLPDFFVNKKDSIDIFKEHVGINHTRNSYLVNVSYTSNNPEMAASVANAIAQNYIDFSLEKKFDTIKDAMSWLDQRTQQERQALENSEKNLQQYKESVGLLTNFAGDTEEIIGERLKEFNKEAVVAESKRVDAEKRFMLARRNGEQLETIPEIMNNDVIRIIKQSEVTVSQKLADLSKTYGPNYPQVQAAKAELTALQHKRSQEISHIINTLKNEYEVALEREKSIKASLERQKNEAMNLSRKASKFTVLSRDVDSSRGLYDSLMKRLKEASLDQDLRSDNIQIIDRAEIPLYPIVPNKPLILSVAIILGLFLSGSAIVAIEYMDNTVKTPEDLQHLVQARFLGPVPYYKFNRVNGVKTFSLIAFTQPMSHIGEAYRGLRTNILFSTPDNPSRCIGITSSLPGEGKSTTCANLAVTIALHGLKTVVLDCDLRKPILHKYFNTTREKGLTNILVEDPQDYKNYIHKTEVPNLFFIPSGPTPPNPSEMLGSNKMNTLIDLLKQDFDQVVIDSPPVISVTDPLVLAKLVDGLVLVISVGSTPMTTITQAVDSLNSVNAPLLGTMMNGVSSGSQRYYNSYYGNYYSCYALDDKTKRKAQASNAA